MDNENEQPQEYEAPAIIYEGKITTRAGSGGGCKGKPCDPVDPADLFQD